MKITPTVGRVVWFYPSTRTGSTAFHPPTLNDPLAAIVAKVIGERMVNLSVFDAHGFTHSMTSVPLLQEAEDVPVDGYYATWMPYQIGQAKKAADREHDAKHLAVASDRAADARRLNAGVLDMALRTPGLTGHDEVLTAARAYQAHIEGEKTLPASHPVQQLADAVGGTIESLERLPDGSGACVLSMPLPADHWLTQPGFNEPPMPFQRGTAAADRIEWADKIRTAAKYAICASTMNGEINDFDPDAMVQNFIVGMLGYWTPDGTSSDSDLAQAAVEQPAQ